MIIHPQAKEDMFVELIGLPGAGKSTLLPFVVDYYRNQETAAFSVEEAGRLFAARTVAGRGVQRLAPEAWRHSLLWQLFFRLSLLYRTRFIITHPRLIWDVVRWQRQRPPEAKASERKVSFWLFRLMGYYAFLRARARPGEVVVFDEGFLHRVVQLFSSSAEQPSKERIARYVDLVPRPDLVIFVKAPPEICENRIYDRGLRQAFRDHDRADLSRFVGSAQRAINLALEHGRRNGWTIIEVDNGSDDLRMTQSALRNRLDHIMARPGAAVTWGTI